ncbi:predicted protein, partial [Postia placenta Mad-698-R]
MPGLALHAGASWQQQHLRLEAALDNAMVPERLAWRDHYRPASVLIRDRVSSGATARALMAVTQTERAELDALQQPHAPAAATLVTHTTHSSFATSAIVARAAGHFAMFSVRPPSVAYGTVTGQRTAGGACEESKAGIVRDAYIIDDSSSALLPFALCPARCLARPPRPYRAAYLDAGPRLVKSSHCDDADDAPRREDGHKVGAGRAEHGRVMRDGWWLDSGGYLHVHIDCPTVHRLSAAHGRLRPGARASAAAASAPSTCALGAADDSHGARLSPSLRAAGSPAPAFEQEQDSSCDRRLRDGPEAGGHRDGHRAGGRRTCAGDGSRESAVGRVTVRDGGGGTTHPVGAVHVSAQAGFQRVPTRWVAASTNTSASILRTTGTAHTSPVSVWTFGHAALGPTVIARAGNTQLRRPVTGRANVMSGIEYFLPGATPAAASGLPGGTVRVARAMRTHFAVREVAALGYAAAAHGKPCMMALPISVSTPAAADSYAPARLHAGVGRALGSACGRLCGCVREQAIGLVLGCLQMQMQAAEDAVATRRKLGELVPTSVRVGESRPGEAGTDDSVSESARDADGTVREVAATQRASERPCMPDASHAEAQGRQAEEEALAGKRSTPALGRDRAVDASTPAIAQPDTARGAYRAVPARARRHARERGPHRAGPELQLEQLLQDIQELLLAGPVWMERQAAAQRLVRDVPDKGRPAALEQRRDAQRGHPPARGHAICGQRGVGASIEAPVRKAFPRTGPAALRGPLRGLGVAEPVHLLVLLREPRVVLRGAGAHGRVRRRVGVAQAAALLEDLGELDNEVVRDACVAQ